VAKVKESYTGQYLRELLDGFGVISNPHPHSLGSLRDENVVTDFRTKVHQRLILINQTLDCICFRRHSVFSQFS
jgi:hypothetical protein